MNTKLYEEAIDVFGKDMQMVVAIEELSELQKELTKALRDKARVSFIIEEMADVYIILEQLFLIFDIKEDQIVEKLKEKTERLARLIEGKKNERV